MEPDPLECTYRRVAEVDHSRVGERVVLSNEQRGKAIVLNPSGTRLWQLLEKPQSVSSLAAGLREAYPDLDDQQAENDVKDYLVELEREGVIRRDE